MIRFDTRDKKPKVTNILVLTIAVAILVGILAATDAEAHGVAIVVVLDVYFAAVIALLVAAFVKQLGYNPYSYNTILYMGFALFLVSLLVTYLTVTRNIIRHPEDYQISGILRYINNSAKEYMLLSFPFLAGFSALLVISNIQLIRREGRRVVNALGILLAALIVGGVLILYRWDYYASGSVWQVMIHDLLTNLFAAFYLYFESMLLGTIVASLIAARYQPDRDKDYLIILGCGLRRDGTPTPLLAGRIERALAFYRQQKEETGKELTFVTSGGQGPNEVISESAAMRQYLLAQGIPDERIIEEDASTSTFENMKFSKEKILGDLSARFAEDGTAARSADDGAAQSVEAERREAREAGADGSGRGGLDSVRIAYATTNYHVFRSGLHARRVKMRAVGMGAKTRWYFWPNAWVREFVGLLTEHRGKQALVLGGMIAFYTIFTIFIYR